MKIDERLKGFYEGDVQCDLCKRKLDADEPIDIIQTDMVIEKEQDETTHVQYGDVYEQTVLCKECSTKVEVRVSP